MFDFFLSYICPWYVDYLVQRYLYLWTKKSTNQSCKYQCSRTSCYIIQLSFLPKLHYIKYYFQQNFFIKEESRSEAWSGLRVCSIPWHFRYMQQYNDCTILHKTKIICDNLSFLNYYFGLRALIDAYTDLKLMTHSPKGPTFMVQNIPDRTTKDLGMQ